MTKSLRLASVQHAEHMRRLAELAAEIAQKRALAAAEAEAASRMATSRQSNNTPAT